MNNFTKTERVYAQNDFQDIKDSHITGKQRRNAVQELFRFICSTEFPVDLSKSFPNDDELYDATY